jgi:hypothetical protein
MREELKTSEPSPIKRGRGRLRKDTGSTALVNAIDSPCSPAIAATTYKSGHYPRSASVCLEEVLSMEDLLPSLGLPHDAL